MFFRSNYGSTKWGQLVGNVALEMQLSTVDRHLGLENTENYYTPKP